MKHFYSILLLSFFTILFSKDDIKPKDKKIELNTSTQIDKSKKLSINPIQPAKQQKRKSKPKKQSSNFIQSPGKNHARKDKIDIHDDDFIFDDKSKMPKRSPELQARLDALREEANEEIKALRKKYRHNLELLKTDYKLRRDEIVGKFKNKRKK